MAITTKLITLDSLFDTRLSCIKKFNKGIAGEIIQSDKYFLRSSNVFSLLNNKVNDEIINRIWKHRDDEILRMSFATNIINILKQIVDNYSILDNDHPEYIEMHLVISLYPYTIQKKELKELIRSLKFVIKPKSILCTKKGIKDLSPIYIKDNYDHLIIHDLDEWITIHCDELKENPIPFTTITGPVIHNKLKIHESINPLIYDKISLDLGTHVNVELLPLSEYSICPPIDSIG